MEVKTKKASGIVNKVGNERKTGYILCNQPPMKSKQENIKGYQEDLSLIRFMGALSTDEWIGSMRLEFCASVSV